MVIEEEKPSGDEAADFADMLRKFKQGIAENVSEEDHESHYDLGVAYKEMGLVDEAVAEFQKALRGHHRVRTYEALGQCFIEKQQFQVAATILSRALSEIGVTDDQLVGVLYLVGYASEALMQWEAAVGYYQRVFAVDIRFRDAAQRLAALERTPR
jgi:tetratricopeptide (TPR) repeat protein